MPRLLLIHLLTWLSVGAVLAQPKLPAVTKPIFSLDSLPVQGTMLNQGWRWHPGDNPAWADPTVDDQQWNPIDPTKDIMNLPQVRQAGIGWFRLHLALSPAVRNESLALMIEQTGASEVYVNGRLQHHFGKIDPTDRLLQTFDPRGRPVPFAVQPDSLVTLAIRFAFARNLPYTVSFARENMNPLLRVKVSNVTNAVQYDQVNRLSGLPLDYLKVGIYFILTILHLTLYLHYPVQRTNFYFSMFALSCLLTYLLQTQAVYIDTQETLQPTRIAIGVTTLLFQLLLLTALYKLFNQPLSIPYWLLFIYFFVCIPLTVWPYRSGLNYGHSLYSLLCYVEMIRITILAVRQKKRGAVIVMRGTIIALLFMVIYGLMLPYSTVLRQQFFITGNAWYYALLHLPYNISDQSIPVAISLYLGLEFGFTNQTLAGKMVEIETLSAYTRQQAQEKQQLLATQNERLEQQVEVRTAELRASQAQLIQREKLASLGELTAGIAHEIQNPLNFVNNFSEVSAELVSELKEELDKGDTQEAKAIANDLTQNLQKITHHGGRASSIVKGMLEHSRSSTGERQPTNLNALADEYLRLSYHGLRAKDKSFTCELVTELDSAIGELAVMPQEMGRVLLNLFNNAFYAVRECQKLKIADYHPTVTVSTQKAKDGIQIRVADNGTGMSESVQQKIFQPFFTTKPTGEGTGLGLSLSYDIITKGHGGSLLVQSEEGEGTEFIIELPAS